ncbi:S41 family peptidase [Sphingosinicella ginsenosidimutans]
MMRKPSPFVLGLSAFLAACGGGGSGGGFSGSTPPGAGNGGTPPSTGTCALRSRQQWALAQLREWYLFPETLPANLDPAGYSTLEDYVDALTANARSQGKDRFFTYVTSRSAEDAFNNQGASAGFGIQLGFDSAANRVFVIDAYEGAPALAAGIDRGTEILAVGTSSGNLQNVSTLLASGGSQAFIDALGPSTAGTTRVLRVNDAANGTREVTITKADYSLQPVSPRFGAQIINDNGHRVGYVNLRTFISTADQQLSAAFASFRAQGITEIIVDLRYNGGGLIDTADHFGDLLGGNRASTDVFETMAFRPEKSSYNTTHFFRAQPQSVSPTRIAFIGTGGTASASELVINGMVPFLHANAALIGTNTYGKPVGQIAIDQTECDDRFRIIAFSLQNAAHNGNYFNGLASTVEASCRASDDIGHQMGDPAEASTRQALDFVEGRGTCTPITAATTQGLRQTQAPRELIMPRRPSAAQFQVPGMF